TCVTPGPNLMLQSPPGGDDVALGGGLGTNNGVQTGANGICQTTLVPDDTYAPGLTLGGGSPFERIIIAGASGNNGICDSVSVAAGDDVIEAPPGTSTPRQAGIRPGPNTTLDSVAAGDDVATMLICADPDAAFQSTPIGD